MSGPRGPLFRALFAKHLQNSEMYLSSCLGRMASVAIRNNRLRVEGRWNVVARRSMPGAVASGLKAVGSCGKLSRGEVAERLNAAVSKTVMSVNPASGVRIPPSPLFSLMICSECL